MKNFFRPFEKVAGAKALAWGLAGLAVSSAASVLSGWHADGLLHFGSAPSDAWWSHVLEYLIIWLVPAAVIYGLGAALSKSRIRAIDVFGTVAFAMLPLAVLSLLYLLPDMRYLLNATEPLDITALMSIVMKPFFIFAGIVMLAVVVLMLVWLFGAVKVSCNLKGWQLWVVYIAGVFGGDVLCRLLISLMY